MLISHVQGSASGSAAIVKWPTESDGAGIRSVGWCLWENPPAFCAGQAVNHAGIKPDSKAWSRATEGLIAGLHAGSSRSQIAAAADAVSSL